VSPERWIERLGLEPHPEGGHFREVYRAAAEVEHPGLDGAPRSAATHIYFLLRGDELSAFHRVTASDEIWNLYAGSGLELHLIHEDGRYERRLLGVEEGAEPVVVVPAGCWQAARPVAEAGERWALCGGTVVPGFDFADFAMPGVEELVRTFPVHEELIPRLTR
jgi:predicted cupin superfamily sugar epimerase